MDTNMEKPRLLDRLRPNLIWIIFVTLGWYMFIAAFGHLAWESLMESIKGSVSPAMFFTLDLYAATIVDILTLFILCWLFTKNRDIWKSFLIKRGGPDYAAGELLTEDDAYADLYGRRRNGFKMLGMGLLLDPDSLIHELLDRLVECFLIARLDRLLEWIDLRHHPLGLGLHLLGGVIELVKLVAIEPCHAKNGNQYDEEGDETSHGSFAPLLLGIPLPAACHVIRAGDGICHFGSHQQPFRRCS